jgi:SMODS-associated NUDIX domain
VVTGDVDATTGNLVRVSMSVLLRIKDDNRFVLFRLQSRPDSYGPPGGVYKYFPPAARVLDNLDFHEERASREPELTRSDLRGLLPAKAVPEFVRWFESNAYREGADECLRRELREELSEVGLPQLTAAIAHLDYTRLRTVTEGPHEVAGKSYRQLRRFDVHTIEMANGTATWFHRELVAASADTSVPSVTWATRADVEHGRQGTALIAPHTALLFRPDRVMQDIPPVR